MKSIYEEFGCKDKYELYEKIMAEDKEVLPLKEYMYYFRIHGKNSLREITDRKQLKSIVEGIPNPDINKIHVLCVDIKCNLTHLLYNKNIKEKVIYYDIINSSTAACFLISNENDIEKINNVAENLSVLGIKVLDVIDENDFDLDIDRVYIYDKDISFIPKDEKYNRLSGYEEFTQYFIKRELIGLNYDKDNDKIIEILEVGLDRYSREIVGVCTCDDDRNILSIDFIFSGSMDTCVVGGKEIFKNVMDKNIKNFFVFHNHPSGNSVASFPDYVSTERLLKGSEILDMNMIEHIIFGKDEFFKLSQHPNKDNICLKFPERKPVKESMKDGYISFSIPKDYCRERDGFKEVELPEGTYSGDKGISGSKFYPLISETLAEEEIIYLKKGETVYLKDNDLKKLESEKLLSAVTDKTICKEKKRLDSIKKDFFNVKDLGEEL